MSPGFTKNIYDDSVTWSSIPEREDKYTRFTVSGYGRPSNTKNYIVKKINLSNVMYRYALTIAYAVLALMSLCYPNYLAGAIWTLLFLINLYHLTKGLQVKNFTIERKTEE